MSEHKTSEQQTSEPKDGRGAVLKLRNELLQLVAAYNAVGSYKHAAKAQAMAVALHDFEDAVIITHMAWPPRVEHDEHGAFIPDLDGKPVDTDE
jgi:hypothetical protein